MNRSVFLFLVCILFVFCSREPSLVRNHLSIYSAPSEYCAWPSMVRAENGDILVTFCQSEEHLGPDGRILLMRSTDNGQSWEGPQVIYDSPLDDRESGLTPLRDGRILVHIYSMRFTRSYYESLPDKAYEPQVLSRWIDWVEQPSYSTARDHEGSWIIESRDHGRTWSEPRRGPDSNHGGIHVNDGRLLVPAYRKEQSAAAIYRADSAGINWELAAIVAPPAEIADSLRFGEPHLVQLPSGRIILMMRATAIPYNDQDPKCVLWQSYSDDGGDTWADPFPTPLWGFPPHLLLLEDGRVLCTYGYRRPPYGQRACISADGLNWNLADEVVLRDDAANPDLGYPVSIELEPGTVLTVYYQPDVNDRDQRMHPPDPERSKPDITGTIWTLPAPIDRR
ncbi:exo-alpha-sialidase [candidate division KSB1 bacterium]|nr:exo-alpha-sialidase [candidate division KSB1 bacterium]